MGSTCVALQDERSEDESDSYSYDSADSEDSETASGYAKTLEKRRYLWLAYTGNQDRGPFKLT